MVAASVVDIGATDKLVGGEAVEPNVFAALVVDIGATVEDVRGAVLIAELVVESILVVVSGTDVVVDQLSSLTLQLKMLKALLRNSKLLIHQYY